MVANKYAFLQITRRGVLYFFFQAEDGIRGWSVTGVQTCALPICTPSPSASWRTISGPRGKEIVRHEADGDGVPQRPPRKRSLALVAQDHTPPDKPDRKRQRGECYRQHQEKGIDGAETREHLAPLRPSHGPRQESDRDREAEDPGPAGGGGGSGRPARGWARGRGQRGRRLRRRARGARRPTPASPLPAAPSLAGAHGRRDTTGRARPRRAPREPLRGSREQGLRAHSGRRR